MPWGGMAASPNSRFFYLTNYHYVAQIDMAANPPTLDTVAYMDGFTDPFGEVTNFWSAQLGIDDKVYITNWSDNIFYSVIANPDAVGTACNVQQHVLALPTFNSGTIPHYPNYRLGPVDGSVCDSLGINTATATASAGRFLGAFPNPTDGSSRVVWTAPLAAPAELTVANSLGAEVQRTTIAAGSSYTDIDLKNLPNGIYFVSLQQNRQQNGQPIKLVKL